MMSSYWLQSRIWVKFEWGWFHVYVLGWPLFSHLEETRVLQWQFDKQDHFHPHYSLTRLELEMDFMVAHPLGMVERVDKHVQHESRKLRSKETMCWELQGSIMYWQSRLNLDATHLFMTLAQPGFDNSCIIAITLILFITCKPNFPNPKSHPCSYNSTPLSTSSTSTPLKLSSANIYIS